MHRRSLFLSLLVSALWMFAWSETSRAEWYIAGQGGYQFPQDLADVRGTGSFSGVTSNDLTLNNQAAFGLKVGHVLHGSLRWLGLEFDFSHSDANIADQRVTAGAPILGITQQNGRTPGVGLSVNHMTVNVIARYPGSQVQPYVGVGGGLGLSRLRTAPQDETAVYPVFNVLIGMKVPVTKHVALFTEYKHARATVEFSDHHFEGDLRTNWFMGGLAYHF
ncbi:MAG: outer membrane beta-barrel protein [Nitrospira sp.]|nr:outer membrane beta-barrel protein [Nitrospira sp.]